MVPAYARFIIMTKLAYESPVQSVKRNTGFMTIRHWRIYCRFRMQMFRLKDEGKLMWEKKGRAARGEGRLSCGAAVA